MRYSLEGSAPPKGVSCSIERYLPDEVLVNDELKKVMVELWKQLDKAEDIYEKPFGDTGYGPSSDKGKIETLRKPTGEYVYFVKTSDGVYVGLAKTMQSQRRNTYMINTVVIDKDYRGNGIGKMLIKQIMTDHPKQYPILNVSPNNPNGLKLYKSLGFVPMSICMINMKKSKGV